MGIKETKWCLESSLNLVTRARNGMVCVSMLDLLFKLRNVKVTLLTNQVIINQVSHF